MSFLSLTPRRHAVVFGIFVPASETPHGVPRGRLYIGWDRQRSLKIDPRYYNPPMPPPWIHRTFTFNLPEDLFPVVVERLRGTPARVEDKVRSLPAAVLTRRQGEAWSIQEHIGHLLDLDELHAGRLDDFLVGAPVLRAADMANRKTHEAGHNARPIADLLRDFRRKRERFVARLDACDPVLVSLTALHPRLQQPMRVIDMAFFTAEHDDHHLSHMTELARY